MQRNTFLEKITRASSLDCWEWLGARNNSGYGTVRWEGKTVTAHRLSAYLFGMVEEPAAPKNPKGSGFVLHTCDNPRCCNPNHFTVGTYSTNQSEAYQRKRKEQPKGQFHANSKLTNEEVSAIRERYKYGYTQTNLAKEYGVSQTAISLIIREVSYQ